MWPRKSCHRRHKRHRKEITATATDARPVCPASRAMPCRTSMSTTVWASGAVRLRRFPASPRRPQRKAGTDPSSLPPPRRGRSAWVSPRFSAGRGTPEGLCRLCAQNGLLDLLPYPERARRGGKQERLVAGLTRISHQFRTAAYPDSVSQASRPPCPSPQRAAPYA